MYIPMYEVWTCERVENRLEKIRLLYTTDGDLRDAEKVMDKTYENTKTLTAVYGPLGLEALRGRKDENGTLH